MSLVLKSLGIPNILSEDVVREPTPTVEGWEIYILPIRAEVYETSENLPLLGQRAKALEETDQPVRGFIYDRRRWQDQQVADNQPWGTISLETKTDIGTLESYWQSGVTSLLDCTWVGLYSPDTFIWFNKIEPGHYNSLNNTYVFPSSYSVVNGLINDYASVNVQNGIELSFNPDIYPVTVDIFKRSSALEARPYINFKSTGSFTGIWDGEYLATTDEDGVTLWDNVDTFNRWELIQDSNTIYLNQNPCFTVGINTESTILNGDVGYSTQGESLQNVEFFCERLGESNDNWNQQFFTYFFPIDPTADTAILKVYVWDGTQVRLWSLATANQLAYHDSTEYVYSVDYDYGIIKFAVGANIETRLSDDITDIDIELPVLSTEGFPYSGRLLIDSEEMGYLSKDDYNFYQLIRTAPVAHTTSSIVAAAQAGSIPSGNISATYQTTPRIEYEPVDFPKFYMSSDVNVHPLANTNSNGIVYISRKPPDVATLELSINLSALGNNHYGPLYGGNNYALLSVTAYDGDGVILPNIEVTIDQLDYPFIGLLNGVNGAYTGMTNSSGILTVPFYVGTNLTPFGVTATDSQVVVGGTTTITVPGNYSDVDLDKVLLFTITKDDPTIGTVGIFTDGSYVNTSIQPEAASTLTVSYIIANGVTSSLPVGKKYGESFFNGATVYIHDTGGNDWESTVVSGQLTDTFQLKLFLQTTIGISDPIDYVRLVPLEWVEWNGTDLNGRKKVVYIYDTGATNPVTGELGAYYPVTPDSVSWDGTDTTFTFSEVLEAPDSSDVENNVGGYWLNVAFSLGFQASTRSFITNETVNSNELYVNIELPDYLTGVKIQGSSRTPYGFRLYENLTDASTGLDGATFITINPFSGTYQTISNPFMSITHLLDV